MESFTDLIAWKKGMELVQDVYRLSNSFPREELYALTAQLRKASTSILANTAEGFGRFTYADKANKYTIARGECAEVQAFMWIAASLGFIKQENAEEIVKKAQEVGRILSGLITACKRTR